MKGLWRKIKLRFLKHEYWALENSIDLPIFSFFLSMTLWIWIFIPSIALGMLYTGLSNNVIWLDNFSNSPWAIIPLIGVTAPISVALLLWWGRWYLICAGLLFGSDKSALTKLGEVQAKLKALTDA